MQSKMQPLQSVRTSHQSPVRLSIDLTYCGSGRSSGGCRCRLLCLLLLLFRGLVCVTDSDGARGVVPVAPADLNAVPTNIRAQEPEIQTSEAATLADDLRDLRDLLGDDRVEARRVIPVLATNVASKVDKLGIKLLNDTMRANLA